METLSKKPYTASMSLQALLSLSAVCPVYFTDLISSSLTLSSFSGSGISVYGTSITTNASGTQDPTWECSINGFIFNSSSASPTSENNWILCGDGPFVDGHYILTVNVTVSNQQTFWFDQIRYTPSASVPLNQQFLYIDSGDSAIQYNPGWVVLTPRTSLNYSQNAAGNSTSTNTSGTTLSYQFSGSYW